jgi:serine/threonine-protein kinase
MKDGDVLDGRYELVRCIGGGGMGSVWEAFTLSDGRRVAIKALHEHLVDERDLVARFLQEAEAALESRYSAHIIEVLDVVHPPGRAPYLVMEYLEGEDLAQILEHEGPMAPARAAQLIIQACHAVAEVHRQGIIHRDVKPENLFVTRLPDGTEWIKLLDFGVAKFSASPDSNERPLTAAGSTLGTPFYMAPEQVLISQTLDHRLDVYSMGVVLYELLTDARPFESKDIRDLMIMIARGAPPLPRTWRPDLDEELERVVLRAMALSRDDRYDSMYDLAEDLEPFAHSAAPSGGTARRMETYNTVVQRAIVEGPPTDPSGAAVLPTSPSLRPIPDEDEGHERSVDVEAPTVVAVRRIDAADVESQPVAVTPRGRYALLLALGLGLGLAAAVVSFLLVVFVFHDDDTAPHANHDPPRGAEARDVTSPGAGAVAPIDPPDDDAHAGSKGPGDWWTPSGLVTRPVASHQPPAVDADVPDAEQDHAGDEAGPPASDGGVVPGEATDADRSRTTPRTPQVAGGKTLSRTEVLRGLQSLQPQVRRCVEGTVTAPIKSFRVVFRIFGDGSVAYVSSEPRVPPQITTCLRHAAQGKRFRRTSADAFNAEFPYRIR